MNTTTDADLPISPAAAARRLEITAETVRAWIRLGTIPAVRSPTGRYTILTSTLLRLLAQRKTQIR
jgi:excisionase family DNA binding protein